MFEKIKNILHDKVLIYKNRKIENENILSNKEAYNSLVPKVDDEVDKNGTYCNMLLWGLNQEKIKNIALTGIYGAGKSSIIEKLVAKNKNRFNFFQISLASFTGNTRGGTQDIEECVLQQIFYQSSPKHIPQSRFKKIKHISNLVFLKYELYVIIVSVLGSVIFFPNIIDDLFILVEEISLHKFSVLNINIPYFFSWVIFSLFFFLVFLMVDKIIKYIFRGLKLNRISIKNNIEFGNRESDTRDNVSIFNKHLDEILYFFEATKYDVIIFEDLDRFDNHEIFIKLRELNILLNNYENIKRKIVFVYAVKDDLFTDKERTKFFDFIIPVIPFLNSLNSFEILNREIKCMKLSDVCLSEEYLLDISPFIMDMRLLDNIVNEFKIYWLNLSKSFINSEKMFSMIVYKNMCPKDFSLLQINKGFISGSLNNKYDLVKKKIDLIDVELEKINKELEKIKDYQFANISELINLFIGFFVKVIDLENNMPRIDSLEISYFNNEELSVEDFILSEEIDYSSMTNIVISYQSLYGRSRIYNCQNSNSGKEFMKFIHSIPEKKNRIRDYCDGSKEKLLAKKNRYINERNSLETANYSEIANEMEIEYSKEFSGEQYDIAKFFLKRGYIDETYQNYISYFHHGKLTIDENNFILSVKNGKSVSRAYKLHNISLVIAKMDRRDFLNPKLFNINIFYYFINNDKDDSHYIKCKDTLFNTLFCELEESENFLVYFISNLKSNYNKEEYETSLKRLIVKMCETNNLGFTLLAHIFENNSDLISLAIITIEVLKKFEIEEIEMQNNDGNISNAISKLPNFITLVEQENIKNIHELLEQLNVTFVDLELEGRTELSDYIFENNFFEINMNYFYNLNKLYFENNDSFYIKNYTIINSSNLQWLKEFIEKNMVKYIKYILFEFPDNTKENIESVLKLLVNSGIDINLKIKLIEKQDIEFLEWGNIPSELYNNILTNNKIYPTWENIECYYKIKGYDDIVEEYISSNKIKLSNERLTNSKLSLDVLMNTEIAVYLLKHEVFNDVIYEFEDIKSLNVEVIKLIIVKNLIEISPDNFNSITDIYPQLAPNILKKTEEIEDFCLDDCIFNNVNSNAILKSNEINVEMKKNVISLFDFNKLSFDNIETISYFIADFCNNKIDDDKFIILFSRASKKAVIHLINSLADSLSNNKIIYYLSNCDELKDIFVFRKRPKLEKNQENYEFLSMLVRKELISSFDEKKNKYIVYTKKLDV